MAPISLGTYLAEANPFVDDTQSLRGPPTQVDVDEDLKTTPWVDFTFENLNNCYGDVLTDIIRDFSSISPALSDLEREIFDEDSLDHLLSRSVVSAVSDGLREAGNLLHPHDKNRHIDVTRGGRARNPHDNIPTPSGTLQITPERVTTEMKDKPKIYPDWAGVRKTPGSITYANRCPGETKLSTKWESTGRKTGEQEADEYMWPLVQVKNYSVKNWRTRYGYIITQKELVVLRFSRYKICGGLVQTRSQTKLANPLESLGSESSQMQIQTISSSPSHRSSGGLFVSPYRPGTSRPHQRRQSNASTLSCMSVDMSNSPPIPIRMQGHQRNASAVPSTASDRMSLDDPYTSSRRVFPSDSVSPPGSKERSSEKSYVDDGSGGPYRPVEMMSIPWDNHGPNKLTVKLALWWIHMLAAAPTDNISVHDDYPPLNEWTPVDGGFRHTTTERVVKKLPKGSILGDAQASRHRSSTPPRQETSSAGRPGPTTPPNQTARHGQAPATVSTTSTLTTLGSTPSPVHGSQNLPQSELTVEDITYIQPEHKSTGWVYKTGHGSFSEHMEYGRPVWSRRHRMYLVAQLDKHGQTQWVTIERAGQTGGAHPQQGRPQRRK